MIPQIGITPYLGGCNPDLLNAEHKELVYVMQ